MPSVTRLDDFGFLAVTGRDAQKFLQGYVTCDMQNVSGGKSAIGAICNLQGRMVTSFRIAASNDGFVLRMHKNLVPATMDFLGKYIVFSRAEMDDCSQTLGCFAVSGELPNFPAGKDEVMALDDGHVVRVASAPRFEVWTHDLEWSPQDAKPMNPALWRSWEIEAGIVWVTPDTSEQFIPQMFDYHLLGGVDFDKGCYLGQEIVARMQYRGALSRRLFRGAASRPVAAGDVLADEQGKTVGEVVAAEGSALLAVIQVKDDVVPVIPGVDLHATDAQT